MDHTEQPSTPRMYVRKSKPKTEAAWLQYAITPRGAYRIKKAYRMMNKKRKNGGES